MVGKSIKDKRGGKNNIHSWDIDLKGETSQQERDLMNVLLLERRKKTLGRFDRDKMDGWHAFD